MSLGGVPEAAGEPEEGSFKRPPDEPAVGMEPAGRCGTGGALPRQSSGDPLLPAREGGSRAQEVER